MQAALQQVISPRAIKMALGLAGAFYIGMIALSFVKGASVLDTIERQMPAQSIEFESASQTPLTTGGLTESDKSTPEVDYSGDIRTALPPGPFEGLSEDTPFGLLPKIGENNLTPFDAYKKPVVVDVQKPIIAIGVTGLGFSQELYTDVFERLSPHASMILSPYVSGVDAIQQEARKQGYEVWLEVPLENQKFPNVDPGSKGILANAGLKFNQDNYKEILGMTSGYVGIVSYTDSAFANAKPMLNGILGDAFARGLGFFELNPGRDSMSMSLAVNARGPIAVNSLRYKERQIEDHFTAFKRLAKRNSRAVGVLELSPALLNNYQKELAKAQAEGFQIVPISAAVDKF